MREFLDEGDLLSELIMVRTRFDGALLVLEGEADCQVFDKFTTESCKTIPGHGREFVVEAVRKAKQAGLIGVLGVVDADFHRLAPEERVRHPDLLITDAHDLELMMIRSLGFIRLVNDLGSEAKISRFLEDRGVADVASALLAIVAPVGALRLHKHRLGLNLNFNRVNLASCITSAGLEFDLDGYLVRLLNVPGHGFKSSDLQSSVDRILRGKPFVDDLCCGDDVIAALSVGLRRTLGSCRHTVADPDLLRKLLRTAYDLTEFKKTKLYEAIKKWESLNSPHTVLAA